MIEEIIILKRVKFKEQDLKLSIISPTLGLIDIYAYGALSSKSRYKGILEPFTLGQAKITSKKGFKLLEDFMIHHFFLFTQDLQALDRAYQWVLLALSVKHNFSNDLYFLYRNAFFFLEIPHKRSVLHYTFLSHFFIIEGYIPLILEEEIAPEASIFLDIYLETFIIQDKIIKNNATRASSLEVKRGAYQFLLYMQNSILEDYKKLKLLPETEHNLMVFFDLLIKKFNAS